MITKMSEEVFRSYQSEVIDHHVESDRISEDVIDSVHDAQLVVAHVARDNENEVAPQLMETLIKSRFYIEENKWTPRRELDFRLASNELSTVIHPITTESLKATMPAFEGANSQGAHKIKTDAEKAVSWYRGVALFSLVLLIAAQIYWIIGNDLQHHLSRSFEKIIHLETGHFGLKSSGKPDASQTVKALVKYDQDLKIVRQRFRTAYVSMQTWNRVWQTMILSPPFKNEIPPFFKRSYEQWKAEMQEKKSAVKNTNPVQYRKYLEQEQARDERLHLDSHRIKLFRTLFAADFVLDAMYSYFLPLLYGFLGATVYVLRELSQEVKGLLYSHHSQTGFGLRLSLGALAGMTIGWFMSPDNVSAIGSIGPMTLAFLTGYNVEILFSFMDKIIDTLTSGLEKQAGIHTGDTAQVHHKSKVE